MKIQPYSRRNFLKTSGIGVAGLMLPITLSSFSPIKKESWVFIGTYTDGKSEGIYLYKLNTKTGSLQHVNTTSGINNPSYLTVDLQRKVLYAVNEISDFEGKESGAVSAYSIDPSSGALSLLNMQPTHGGAPCYVEIDKSGKTLLVANYKGGNVAIYPILPNGYLDQASDVIDHKKSQKTDKDAHAHCIVTDPENNFAFATDLGLDKIFIYKLNPILAELTLHKPSFVSTKEGAGPRHFTFHKNGKFAFVINELNSTITSYAYDKRQGNLEEIQTLSTLPSGYTEKSFCADVHVHPNGKFLYGSNRGHNSIAVFEINQKSGNISLVEHASTQGDWPRNFAIDPSGRILMVANQKSNDIFTFFIDAKTGKLTATGNRTELAAPVCLKVVPDKI